MTSLRASSSAVTEDVSGMERKYELMKTLPDLVWVLKVAGSVTIKNSAARDVTQFFGGVCIGSKGLILTTSQGMNPELEGAELDHKLVFGRPRNNPSFKKLKIVWKDSEEGLMIFQVEDDAPSESYLHTDISHVASIDSDLIGISVNGDQPFSRFACYAPGHAAKFNGTTYLTVYGKCLAVASNIFDDAIVATTMAGSPIFNGESGELVGIVALGVESYCLALQLNKRVIKKLKDLK